MSVFSFLRRSTRPSAAVAPPQPRIPTDPPQPAETAPAPRAVAPGLTVEMKLRGRRGSQGPALQTAENLLAELQTVYRLGQYSGHPEEMLEDIGDAEAAVKRLWADSPA